MDKFLTVREFSKEVGKVTGVEVSHDTIFRLVKKGVLKGKKKNPFGATSAIMIPASELKKYVQARRQA